MNTALLVFLCLAQDEAPGTSTTVDQAVRSIPGYNQKDSLPPVPDDVFLRRVTKDLADAAPTNSEVADFVVDKDPKKRAKAINRLLADDRFAATWAKRFEGVFFVDVLKHPWTGVPDLTTDDRAKAVGTFSSWLAKKLRDDKPWTEIVVEMLDARGTLEGDPALAYLLSFRRGKGFEVEFAENMPQQLLGIRLRCARCHDHPYDKWRVEDFYGMAAFVARQRARPGKLGLEVTYADDGEVEMPGIDGSKTANVKMGGGGVAAPVFLFGGAAGKNDDRMKVLIGFMTARANTQLPRMLANRVWGWLLGSGVVDPVDDFNLKNKALSPALMETLTRTVIEGNYSIQHLVRVICNTQAYQQPTPEEILKGESYRHFRAARGSSRPFPAATSVLPLSMDLPAGWQRVKERGASQKGLFVIPHPESPRRWAELKLVEARLHEDLWMQEMGRIDPLKSTVLTLTGKGGRKITFTERSGSNCCVQGSSGPVDFRHWVAVVEGEKPYTLYVGASGTLLDPWRTDFIALLQSISLK